MTDGDVLYQCELCLYAALGVGTCCRRSMNGDRCMGALRRIPDQDAARAAFTMWSWRAIDGVRWLP